MKKDKIFNSISYIITGIFIPIVILIVLFIISSLFYEKVFSFKKINFLVWLSLGISLVIALLVRKNKLLRLTIIIFSAGLSCLLLYKAIFKKTQKNELLNHVITWDNLSHKTAIPFYVSPSGHLYIKTAIKGDVKYLLFDTGADFTVLHEKYMDNVPISISEVIDSNNKTEKTGFHILDSLKLSEIGFSNVSYMSLKKNAWGDCGFFKGQDSVAGILGNNVINNFVWDIDMVNRTMEISDKKFNGTTELSNILRLYRNRISWDVEIGINGIRKRLKLDTGSNGGIGMTDSLVSVKKYTGYHSFPDYNKSAFSYKDCMGEKVVLDTIASGRHKKKNKRNVFADVAVGDTIFKNSLVRDNNHHNLFGIPFFWGYERVVLDFVNRKMYFINPINAKYVFRHSFISELKRWNIKKNALKANGSFICQMKDSLLVKAISRKTKDTVNFKFKGAVTYYGNIANDTITMDSIKGFKYFSKNHLAKEAYTEEVILKNNLFKLLDGEELWESL